MLANNDFKRYFRRVLTPFVWLWRVFAALLVIVSFIAILYFTGARETWLWLNAKTWEEAQCQIDQVFSGRKEKPATGSTSWSVRFKVSASYRYRTDYGAYVGDRYDFRGIWDNSYQSVKKDLEYLRNNTSVPCYFNPRNPKQSVINRSYQFDALIMFIPLLSLGAFAYLAFVSLLGSFGIRRKPEREKLFGKFPVVANRITCFQSKTSSKATPG